MEKIKGVVFDMDGVIIDSEPLYFKVDLILLEHYGVTISQQELEQYVGVVTSVQWSEMIEKYNLNTTLDEAMEKLQDYREEYFVEENLITVEETVDLIKYLKEKDYKIGLASSSAQWFIDRVLESFKIRECFDTVVSGENLKRSKPEPDIYLKAAKNLGIAPENCMAIEDSSAGVNAAKSAGMYTVGYHNPNSGNQDLSMADLTVHNTIDIKNKLMSL